MSHDNFLLCLLRNYLKIITTTIISIWEYPKNTSEGLHHAFTTWNELFIYDKYIEIYCSRSFLNVQCCYYRPAAVVFGLCT